jgi:hypothetical protein
MGAHFSSFGQAYFVPAVAQLALSVYLVGLVSNLAGLDCSNS